MKKEELFLNIISNTLKNSEFLGDDCAYLPEFNLVVSSDALVEDVHFNLKTISPYQLGKKALLVNISDILASGAKPEYLTITLSGSLDENFIKDFYKGADEICALYDLKIIGGDLTGGDKINISITIFGNTKGRNISSRKNAKPGFAVLLAGYHGSSAKGFKILNGIEDCSANKEYFIKSHLEPTLYPKISEIISQNCKNYAMMDTSDGLFDALKKISEASSVGFNIEFNKIFKKTDDFNNVLFGGEDYGLFICIGDEDYQRILPLLDTKNITKIGIVTKDKILIDGKEISKDLSYEHF